MPGINWHQLLFETEQKNSDLFPLKFQIIRVFKLVKCSPFQFQPMLGEETENDKQLNGTSLYFPNENAISYFLSTQNVFHHYLKQTRASVIYLWSLMVEDELERELSKKTKCSKNNKILFLTTKIGLFQWHLAWMDGWKTNELWFYIENNIVRVLSVFYNGHRHRHTKWMDNGSWSINPLWLITID